MVIVYRGILFIHVIPCTRSSEFDFSQPQSIFSCARVTGIPTHAAGRRIMVSIIMSQKRPVNMEVLVYWFSQRIDYKSSGRVRVSNLSGSVPVNRFQRFWLGVSHLAITMIISIHSSSKFYSQTSNIKINKLDKTDDLIIQRNQRIRCLANH